jgi:hypothetical protein
MRTLFAVNQWLCDFSCSPPTTTSCHYLALNPLLSRDANTGRNPTQELPISVAFTVNPPLPLLLQVTAGFLCISFSRRLPKAFSYSLATEGYIYSWIECI